MEKVAALLTVARVVAVLRLLPTPRLDFAVPRALKTGRALPLVPLATCKCVCCQSVLCFGKSTIHKLGYVLSLLPLLILQLTKGVVIRSLLLFLIIAERSLAVKQT